MSRKQKAIEIQIADPCQQAWTEMTPIRNGRFCTSCEKTVVDFSEMSDGEILRIAQQHQGNICGRFRPDQLNRPLLAPQAKKGWHKWKSIAALVSGLLLGNEIKAQSSSPSTAFYQVPQQQKAAVETNLEGIVKDQNGTVLAYATVQLFVDGAFYAGTVSNENGQFKLYVPPSSMEAELEISYMGYQKETIVLEAEQMENPFLEVALKAGIELEEVVVTGLKYRTSCRTMGGAMSLISRAHHVKEPVVQDPEPLVTKFAVAPNPFIDQVQVDLQTEQADHYLFQIYDGNGQLLFAEAKELPIGIHQVPLRLNTQWPAGQYILVVSNRKQNLFTKQLVKMNAQ